MIAALTSGEMNLLVTTIAAAVTGVLVAITGLVVQVITTWRTSAGQTEMKGDLKVMGTKVDETFHEVNSQMALVRKNFDEALAQAEARLVKTVAEMDTRYAATIAKMESEFAEKLRVAKESSHREGVQQAKDTIKAVEGQQSRT